MLTYTQASLPTPEDACTRLPPPAKAPPWLAAVKQDPRASRASLSPWKTKQLEDKKFFFPPSQPASRQHGDDLRNKQALNSGSSKLSTTAQEETLTTHRSQSIMDRVVGLLPAVSPDYQTFAMLEHRLQRETKYSDTA